MSKSLSPTDLYARKQEEKLAADLARAKAEVTRIEGELEAVRSALKSVRSHSQQNDSGFDDADIEDVSTGEPAYANLALTDAAVEYLKTQKKPVSVGMICAVLQQAGYNFTSVHPTRSLGDALAKRMASNDDVFKIMNGLWGYKKNFSPAQIGKLVKRHAGMGGQNAEEHGRLSREGMAAAKANGKRVGAKRKFTVQKAIEIQRLMESGLGLRTACDKAGISSACFYSNTTRENFMNWRPGDEWPPSKTEAANNSDRPNLRVVS